MIRRPREGGDPVLRVLNATGFQPPPSLGTGFAGITFSTVGEMSHFNRL